MRNCNAAYMPLSTRRCLDVMTGPWRRYDVSAVSKPKHPLAYGLYPLVRICQWRFHKDSLAAMTKRMESARGGMA
jgi:hypothetical protein